ncbi:MAG: hypothetical protein EU548_02625 [Promethearchaeota archaeon]|nr:MAG: hypothetical protein EU548_02625 [Candidatus Lokiarchaeota archaeon]
MDKETIQENAEFLKKKLPGMKIPGKVHFRCRYKHMVEFAQCFGLTDPKYVDSEEKGIIACPAYANAFSAKLYVNMATIRFEKDGKMRGFLLDFNKLLHAANEYDWEGCKKIRAGDKLTIEGEIGNIWVNKNMRLFGEIIQIVKNQNDELVCKVKSIATIAPGGY